MQYVIALIIFVLFLFLAWVAGLYRDVQNALDEDVGEDLEP